MRWPFFKKSEKSAVPGKPTRIPAPRRRSYAAANTGRLFASWRPGGGSADVEIGQALSVMRARARDLERNDAYARRYFNLLRTNVVGAAGIRLQNKAKGGDGRPDDGANREIEQGFRAWGKKGVCTVCGGFSWIDVQKLVVAGVARDGEILIRKVKYWPDNEHHFALQLIEADQLDENFTCTLPNGNRVVMGVEKNQWKRPVAYWLLKNHPGSLAGYARQERIRVPADEIVHVFVAERINQTRGVPWIVAGANRIKMLDGYEEAELVAARTTAAKMGFYVSPDGSAAWGEDDPDSKDDEIDVTEAEPGTFEQLPKGWDFKAWDPQHPVAAFAEFEKALLRGVASGWNVSYVALSNNLEGVSYSSIRSGEMSDRDGWRVLQTWVIEHFCDQIFPGWLVCFLSFSGSKLPLHKFDKFNAPTWRPRGWAWVDPGKESAANERDIRNKLRSQAGVAGSLGDDLEEILEDNAKAEELAKKYKTKFPLLEPEREKVKP